MSAPTATKRLLVIEDLAEMLQLTTRAARLILERGELPGFKVGRRWYVRPEVLDAYLQQLETKHLRDREHAARLIRGLRTRGPNGEWPETAAEGDGP